MCLLEQLGGSVSGLEGFSPGSHSWEAHHHGAAGRGGGGWLGRRDGGCEDKEEEWQIPWVLIPITGLRVRLCASGFLSQKPGARLATGIRVIDG